MSKVITSGANALRFTNARNSGNLVAIFEVEGHQYRSTTRVKKLPSDYDKKIFVSTAEDGTLVTQDFPTPNGTVLKMVPFEGWDSITKRDLVSHAADVKWAGNLGFAEM